MKDILQTRMIHWKNKLPSLFFWLVMPIAATLLAVELTEEVQDDFRIPVGVVVEEDTALARELLVSLQDSPLIRLVEVADEAEAVNKIESHELDSAFIVREGYEENIMLGNRDTLITSYQTELSFAYAPVSEMLVSYVQGGTGKSKAAFTIIRLGEQLEQAVPDFETILAKTNEVQEQENLLETSFRFQGSSKTSDDSPSLLTATGIWSIFTILSSLLLSDWVIRERNSGIASRFTFIRYRFHSYLAYNLILYICLFFIFDLIGMFVFRNLLNEAFHIADLPALAAFRLMITVGAFLLALRFRSFYLFYSFSFAIVLAAAILGGAVMPLDGIYSHFPWVRMLNPLQPYMDGSWFSPWLFIFTLILAVWIWKGDRSYA